VCGVKASTALIRVNRLGYWPTQLSSCGGRSRRSGPPTTRHVPTYQSFNIPTLPPATSHRNLRTPVYHHSAPQAVGFVLIPPAFLIRTQSFHYYRQFGEPGHAEAEQERLGLDPGSRNPRNPQTRAPVVRVSVSSLRNFVSDRSFRSALSAFTASISPLSTLPLERHTNLLGNESVRVVDGPDPEAPSHLSQFVWLPTPKV